METIFLQQKQKPTPINVWKNLINDFETTDLLWMIIIALITIGLYYVATLNLRKEKSDWRDIVMNLFLIMGTVIAFFTFGIFDVSQKGIYAYVLLGISFLISLLALILYANTLKNTTKIINSLIIGLLGFGMFYSIVIQELGYFYSVLFGFVGGLLSGRLIHSVKHLTPPAEEEEKKGKTRWKKDNPKDI